MDGFEELLPYYERELSRFRQAMLQFEREHPKTAARLSISNGRTEERYIERMLQSAAWLNARASRRIEDQYPEFTEAYIETVFPAYLWRIPSCSVAQFDAADMSSGVTKTAVMPRGTELEHRPSLCRFRTVWDVTLAPLRITRAQFSPPDAAPPLGVGRLPSDTAGIISIELAAPERELIPDSELMPRTLRVYVHADRCLAAALVDAILLRPRKAFVETDRDCRWQPIGEAPARAAGFAVDEAIVEEPTNACQPDLRLLIEYAAFPQKFHFIDFDLSALLRAAGPCGRLALHLPVATHATSAIAIQRLSQLNADLLRLFCTPVINLFQVDAKPVDVSADALTYPVVLPSSDGPPAVIHSIDSVRIVPGGNVSGPYPEISPYRSQQHGALTGMFRLRKLNALSAREEIGCDTAIQLVNLDRQPVLPNASKLAIKLTCSNGNLPTTIDIGAAQGDLHSEALNLSTPVAMLVSPSASSHLPREDGALWQLISGLSPNHLALSRSGLTTLQELLFQFAKLGPPGAARYIAGITGISAKPAKRMMHIEPAPMPEFVLGTEVTLTINEAAFSGHALHTFAQLMERHLLRYVGGGMELVVNSPNGGEIYRGKFRARSCR